MQGLVKQNMPGVLLDDYFVYGRVVYAMNLVSPELAQAV